MNKCPNCGYNYNDNDAYCAMCGVKLEKDEPEAEVENENENDELNLSKEATIDNINQFVSEHKKKASQTAVNFNNDFFNSAMSTFVIVMISICVLMCASLYLIIKKQESKKLEMRFNNMIENPALIPELKEPKTFLDLKTNLKNNEDFLSLYLKHSKDTPEKKEQVFISYLVEMEKLPHINNENMVMDDLDSCSAVKSSYMAQKCAKRFSKDFKDVGVSAYSDHNTIYLFPDYKFISKRYSKHLSSQMAKYLNLKAKYNVPVNAGITLYLKPKKIADKIYDFERLYTKITDTYIRDEVLKTIYKDFRAFIFSPSIYATTTQEMTKEFKNAYNYFISMRRNSQLRPVVMSYMDKKRSYDETNFQNDYPYKTFEDTFSDNVESSALSDIFVQLRKSLFATNSQMSFTYVYDLSSTSWHKFDKETALSQGEYVFSAADDNNNISIYNNTFSLVQELNIPKYARLFLSNNNLYAYNSDRLSLSKVTFNGRIFSLQQLSINDISTVFPGIHVINIDTYQNYNIYIEKDNKEASYIILSKYSQGFDGYLLSLLKGNYIQQGLSNMFSVSGFDDIELSFHHSKINPKETSENTPTYKIYIHTKGSQNSDGVVNYDEQTAKEEENDVHNPTIMPKIMKNKESQEIEKDGTENLSVPPSQKIEPPDGD